LFDHWKCSASKADWKRQKNNNCRGANRIRMPWPYHRNFINENFEDYFRENILAKWTETSIIILDRASYHKKFPDDMFFFPSKAKKNEIKALMRKISDMIQIVLRKIKTHCFISPGISQKYPWNFGRRRRKKKFLIIRIKFCICPHTILNITLSSLVGEPWKIFLAEIILVETRLPKAINSVNSKKAHNVIQSSKKRYREDLYRNIDPLDIIKKIQQNVDLKKILWK